MQVEMCHVNCNITLFNSDKFINNDSNNSRSIDIILLLDDFTTMMLFLSFQIVTLFSIIILPYLTDCKYLYLLFII